MLSKEKATKEFKEMKSMENEYSIRGSELKQHSSDSNVDLYSSNDEQKPQQNKYSGLPPLPFKHPTQEIYAINIAYRDQRPVSKHPAFRICGGFKNISKLKSHVQNIGVKSYGGANIHASFAHKKFLICTSTSKQQNADYVMDKINRITEEYKKNLSFHNNEFNKNKSEKKMGQTGLSKHLKIKQTSRKKLLDEKFNKFKSKSSESGELSRMVELRNQKVAVISIIDDITQTVLKGIEDPEPIIIIWGCFEDEDQAKHYIYYTSQEKVRDVSLDIVNMYEWVFPTKIDVENIQEKYRDETLDKVMKARKTNKNNVLKFEEWQKQQGMDVPTLEINAHKDEKSGDIVTKVKQLEKPGTEMEVAVPSRSNGKFETLTHNRNKFNEYVFEQDDLNEKNKNNKNNKKNEKGQMEKSDKFIVVLDDNDKKVNKKN